MSSYNPLASSTLGTAVDGPDHLHSGEVKTQPLTLAAGTYARGEVVEMDAATAVCSKLTTAAKAKAVCPHSLTLTAATDTPLYVGGEFNEDAVGLNGVALAPVKAALTNVGIRLRKWGAAPDAAV